jgi:hypothetical protein
MKRAALGILPAIFGLLACTPQASVTSPAPQAPVAPAAAVAEPVAFAASDWTPVPAPAGLLVEVQADGLDRTLATVEKLSRLRSLRTMVEGALDGLPRHLDLTEPVRAIVAVDLQSTPPEKLLDRDPFIGVSLTLKSSYPELLDRARAVSATVTQLGTDRYRITANNGEILCTLGVPPGQKPRLACARGAEASRALEPFLLRNVPVASTMPRDLGLRIQLAPLADTLLPVARRELDRELPKALDELRGKPFGDPELVDAVSTIANEALLFGEELDSLSLAIGVDADRSEATVRGDLAFRDQKSWLVTTLTDRNDRVAPAPEFYWRLPKDASAAMFGTSLDPAHFVGMRRVLRKALGIGLQQSPLAAADQQAVLALLDKIPRTDGVWASASGAVASVPGGEVAKGAAMTPKQAIARAQRFANAWVGWTIASEAGDPAQLVAFLEQLADVYARGVKLARDEARAEVKSASPDMKRYAEERLATVERAPKLTITRNPARLPKGSFQIDLAMEILSTDVWDLAETEKDWDKRVEHPKGAPAKGKLALRIAVVPDGEGRYLYGVSTDGAALHAHLLASLRGAKTEGTLASRTDLGRLRRPLRSGGFISYGRFLDTLQNLGDTPEMAVLEGVVAGLPNKGASPVFVEGGGATGPRPSMRFELLVDKGWMDDLRALIQAGSALAPLLNR